MPTPKKPGPGPKKPAKPEPPLSRRERAELKECEAAIEAGLETFLEVGTALFKIRDGRLYRSSHKTFEGYCRGRWGMSRQRANQLIDAAGVVENLTTTVVTPDSERQARPLVPLEPDLQREAWARAVERAPGGRPTAANVKAVVDEVRAARVFTVPVDPQPPAEPRAITVKRQPPDFEFERLPQDLLAWLHELDRYGGVARLVASWPAARKAAAAAAFKALAAKFEQVGDQLQMGG
jgi:hypothetical protein